MTKRQSLPDFGAVVPERLLHGPSFNFKNMPIYGVTDRPYESLSDADLAKARDKALAEKTDMNLIIKLNTEQQLRTMLAAGAKMMPIPKLPKRRNRR